jgi:hypothetical protein
MTVREFKTEVWLPAATGRTMGVRRELHATNLPQTVCASPSAAAYRVSFAYHYHRVYVFMCKPCARPAKGNEWTVYSPLIARVDCRSLPSVVPSSRPFERAPVRSVTTHYQG